MNLTLSSHLQCSGSIHLYKDYIHPIVQQYRGGVLGESWGVMTMGISKRPNQ